MKLLYQLLHSCWKQSIHQHPLMSLSNDLCLSSPSSPTVSSLSSPTSPTGGFRRFSYFPLIWGSGTAMAATAMAAAVRVWESLIVLCVHVQLPLKLWHSVFDDYVIRCTKTKLLPQDHDCFVKLPIPDGSWFWIVALCFLCSNNGSNCPLSVALLAHLT